MQQILTNAQLQALIRRMSRFIEQSESLLTKYDSVIGDGDHGVSMVRGFQAAVTALEEDAPGTVRETLQKTGTVLQQTIGGASGPIFSALFQGAARTLGEQTELNASEFAAMWQGGLELVVKRGGAVPGDKTMVDALAPAVESMRQAANQCLTLPEVARAAAGASAAGVEATKQMVAKRGRARFLGERGLGAPDPGAVTVSLLFRSMADALQEMLETKPFTESHP